MVEANISAGELAEELCLSYAAPYSWLSGRVYPSDRNVYHLNRILGTNFEAKKEPCAVAMEIGMALRKHRLARNLSCDQVAEMVGVHHNVVANWEAGSGLPGVKSLIRLADAYGMSLDELVGRETA